ncbi:jg26930 [Pararge aegeria aegeria]|uniref:Jg26930 protein n=1 Tax=Pararge aegeria aegeria TaxID=348720 RepID=A0A8S4QIH2_9NEOP|nr:jg26930 [Pararge aegeria aegeria]
MCLRSRDDCSQTKVCEENASDAGRVAARRGVRRRGAEPRAHKAPLSRWAAAIRDIRLLLPCERLTCHATRDVVPTA